MNRISLHWLKLGCFFSFLSVALGAFGAHALKEKLSPRALEIFQTAVHYQFLHAFALLALGLTVALVPRLKANRVGWSFTLGILLFSGSLYALALTDIKILGAITPFGGMAFLFGWLSFALSLVRLEKSGVLDGASK